MSEGADEFGTGAAAMLRRVSDMMVRLQPATVLSVDSDTGTTWVIMDGETAAVPVASLVGPVTPLGRVMVAFVAPGGSYIIGWVGTPTPDGAPVAVHSDTASSAPAGTTVVPVLTVDLTFKAWTAYRFNVAGGIEGSTVGALADMRLQRAGGLQITEFYRWRLEGIPVMNCDATRYVRRHAATDLSLSVELTLHTNSGTAIHVAAPGRPRFLEVYRVGHSAAFPHAVDV